jgi:hypothetical protein
VAMYWALPMSPPQILRYANDGNTKQSMLIVKAPLQETDVHSVFVNGPFLLF